MPTLRPFQLLCSVRCTRPPCQASPSSSGVTATGLKAVAGLLWKKPKPLASSAGIRLRRLQSLASITSRTPSSACSGVAPMGTSPVTTATSASKSMPQSSLAKRASSRGPRKSSLPPWYISGSVVEALRHLGVARRAHQLHVVDVGRAVGPLVGARQRRHALRRIEGKGMARLALVQRVVQVLQLRARGSSSRPAPAAGGWRCRSHNGPSAGRARPPPAGRRASRPCTSQASSIAPDVRDALESAGHYAS